MLGQRAVTGEVQRHPLVRPSGSHIRGAADGGRATTDDNHRLRRAQALVSGGETCLDLICRLQFRLAPEAIGDSGRDDQDVIGFDGGDAVGTVQRHLPRGQVDTGQRALNGAHPIEAVKAVERNPVVPGPVLRPGNPPAQLLSADQTRLRRDAYDLGVLGEPDRRQYAAVPEPRNDHAHPVTIMSATGIHPSPDAHRRRCGSRRRALEGRRGPYSGLVRASSRECRCAPGTSSASTSP